MNERRVVITGLGVVSPNGVGCENFLAAIKAGISGIKFIQLLEKHNFGCQIGGVPDISKARYNKLLDNHGLTPASFSIKYACNAGLEAWEDAGFSIPDYDSQEVDPDTGVVIGSGIGSADIMGDRIVPLTNKGDIKRLRSTIVEHSMFSGPSTNLAAILALGNQITSISSACATGVESILFGYDRIKSGMAKRMLAGATDPFSPYGWAGFDAMRLMPRNYNNNPERGSRPMSASAEGFVPAAGSAVLLLEELESAENRNARIYAEIAGGYTNSGGQRNGGTMTAPNPEGVRKCIEGAIKLAGIDPSEIDSISGHLSSTMADVLEINNWVRVLGRRKSDFPYINSLKSMIGHCIGAAGAIETVAAVLEIYHNFIHPSINCEDLHPEIAKLIDRNLVPEQVICNIDVKCIAKASFGFGDVNSCLIINEFKK